MRRNARVEIGSWISTTELDLLEAGHTGYERLPDPVVHQRTIFFTKRRFSWVVLDTLIGRGDHVIESLLQLAPDSRVRQLDQPPGRIANEVAWALDQLRRAHSFPASPKAGPGPTTLVERDRTKVAVVPIGIEAVAVAEGSFSPRYGQRTPAPKLNLSRSVAAGSTLGYAIVRWS